MIRLRAVTQNTGVGVEGNNARRRKPRHRNSSTVHLIAECCDPENSCEHLGMLGVVGAQRAFRTRRGRPRYASDYAQAPPQPAPPTLSQPLEETR